MPRISRFQLQDSDRDGFTRKKISLVKDAPWKVGGEELDAPPPSRKSLGGEGDTNAADIRAGQNFEVGDLATPTAYDNPVIAVTAAGGITASTVHPWMYVAGSNTAVAITVNPQISAGRARQQLTLVGAGSAVTLSDQTGLSLAGGRPYRIDSGSIIVLMWDSSNSLWVERSRTVP